MNLTEKIAKHNSLAQQIEALEKELNGMGKDIRNEFDKLEDKREICDHYDEMEDSQVKFDVFLEIQKRFGKVVAK